MNNRSAHRQYRDSLAMQLRQAVSGRPRRALLSKMRATNAYGEAFQAHAASQILAGKRADLRDERSRLYAALEARIGNTPLIEFHGLLPNNNRLFIKQEYENNVGHSHYDRVYVSLLKEKERIGLIKPGMNLFETTSGTAGVSFAAIGRELGYLCHVAIPAGGERAREKAIENEGARLYLTPAEQYVNGFSEFIRTFSRAHPDFVFVNHSMGNILGKGYSINETAVAAMAGAADEILDQLMRLGVSKPDYVMSAFGNGTNTLGLARRFRITEPQARVCAYEMVLSGVGYTQKYGEDGYKTLLDPERRFSAADFARHRMPGTSYPGIDFPAAREAISLVDRVSLVADACAEQEFEKVTGNPLPQQVVRAQFDRSGQYGRSTEAGIAAAQKLAEHESGKNFVVIGYDKPDRYDRHRSRTARSANIAIFGGQGRFGAVLHRRLEQRGSVNHIVATADKAHNKEIAANADLLVVAIQRHQVGALLNEIRPVLKPNAHIVSFAAQYPLELVHQAAGRPSARGMADPWWNVSAFMQGPGFSDENIHHIFDGLTKKEPAKLTTDKEIDDFTVSICYAFVIIIGRRFGVVRNAEDHLNFIAPRLGLSTLDIDEFLPKADPDELISLAATKGGISKAIFQVIQDEPDIEPSDLFDRFAENAPRAIPVVRERLVSQA
jgi:S-sulfo-L-cysteine synthase (O-acetyl-L-serine-dependent)